MRSLFLARSLTVALLTTTALCPLFGTSAALAQSLPVGGTVAQGQAGIASDGTTTTVTQQSGRAVINWQSFDVGQGKGVVFAQPGKGSATLNRVTGGTSSTIAGTITSNGSVYLVNPNGIAITATGTVQTGGGFVASTLDISDADFIAGTLKFAGLGGSVANAGRITAGSGAYVALLGGSVSNSGTISVPLGRVGLGSGSQATLDLNGDGFMQVAVPSANGGIDMPGAITAEGGRVELKAAAARDAVRNVVNMSGTISADSATGDAGSIVLLADGGNLTASGTLTARATGASGNGGSVETSGEQVNFAGLHVDTTAKHGTIGTWLVDPTDLTVDDAAAATISGNLATTSVTLQTNADGTTSGPGTTTPGAGDINVNSAISWTSGNALTLTAYHNVNLAAPITFGGTAGAGLTLSAGTALAIAAPIAVNGAGAVSLGYDASSPTDLSFGMTPTGTFAGSVRFANADGSAATGAVAGQSLSLNGTPTTLLYSMTDVAGINSAPGGSYALATNIDATSAGTYGNAVVPNLTGTFEGLGNAISNLSIAAFTGTGGGGSVIDLGLIGTNGAVRGKCTSW